MTGPEHYREAERLMNPGEQDVDGTPFFSDADRIAAAQVHATLAQAAAQALMPVVAEHSDPEASPVLNEWVDAAGRPS